MDNRYFSPGDLKILEAPQRWRLAGTPFPEAGRPPHVRRRRWMRAHQHAHPYPEVLLALAGDAVYGIGNGVQPCRPGSVFVFEPGYPHDLGYPPWTPPVRHLWMSFIQDTIMARLLVVRGGRIHCRGNMHCLPDGSAATPWPCEDGPADAPAWPRRLLRLRWMGALAGIVAALAAEGYRPTLNASLGAMQRGTIDAICRQILAMGGADASLDHLAQVAGYSKFHFLRMFRQHTGRTVHEYVNQARRRKVAALRARGLAFKAISAELGFSCPAAFSRWRRDSRG